MQRVGQPQVGVGVTVSGVELHRQLLRGGGLHDPADHVVDQRLLLHARRGRPHHPCVGRAHLAGVGLADHQAASVGGHGLQPAHAAPAG